MRGRSVLEHFVYDHRQVVHYEFAQDFVDPRDGGPGSDILPELPLEGLTVLTGNVGIAAEILEQLVRSFRS
jgi:hypothetical protein